MVFRYTLLKGEYLDCCKFEYMMDPTIKKLQHRCWPVGPVALIFLVVVFRLFHWGAYLAAAALSLGWVVLVNYLTARIIMASARKKCEQAPETAFRPICLHIGNDSVTVNGKKCQLENYRIFSDLILLFLGDSSTVVLPARVIGGEKVEKLQPVLKVLDRCMK